MSAERFEPTPLRFRPHLEERVWGGRRLERYGRELPPGRRIGESWEISAIEGRSSVVAEGAFAGVTLRELVHRFPDPLAGDAPRRPAAFPLLVKLLDSNEPLSVQLHPRDAEALAIEGPGEASYGKTEAWLILEAEPGARIIHGLAPGVEPGAFFDLVEAKAGERLSPEEEETLFRWVEVRRGDVIYVPAGTIHALGAGIVLAEIQQASDLTYRIYDWGRRDAEGRTRELHIEKARRVRLESERPCPHSRVPAELPPPETPAVEELLSSPYFIFEWVRLGPGARFETSTERPGGGRAFEILFGWEGRVEVLWGGRAEPLRSAEFLLLPAALGDYALGAPEGAALLRVRLPRSGGSR